MACFSYLFYLAVLSSSLSSTSGLGDIEFCKVAKSHGYSCTEYLNEVITEDGYMLTIQRIGDPTGHRVLFQHGLTADSTCFVLNGKQSLPFLLADAGFDCWFGNNRGTTKSSKHKSLSTSDERFWDFSFQDMAEHDLPAEIEFVLNHTGSKHLHYIGHSQGTLQGFAYLINNSEQVQKITRLIALAPVFEVGNIEGVLPHLANLKDWLGPLLEHITHGQLLPHQVHSYSQCSGAFASLCEWLFSRIVGPDPDHKNENDDNAGHWYSSKLSELGNAFPQGTSVKDVVHFAQMVLSGKCQKYDYGEKGNLKKYGKATPPIYDAKKISTYVSLYAGGDDYLADPTDVSHLKGNISKQYVKSKTIDDWNHLAFLFAQDLKIQIGNEIIQSIRND